MTPLRVILGVLALGAVAVRAAEPPARAPAFAARGAFVGLSVADLDASERWYREKLGLEVVFRPPAQEGTRVVALSGGGLLVELIQRPGAVPLREAAPAISHTTMVHGVFKAGIVVDDLEATLAALRARDVEIAMGPFPARDGVPANFLVRDTEGNFLQFFGPFPGALP